MCGISGIIKKYQVNEYDHLIVKKMNNAIYHRGPDGEGNYNNDNVVLAMRRLSIIDLNNGWQPLFNEDKSIVLIANGEIYNYIEIQSQLKSKGHSFRTNSDCESIIHLYEEYGNNFITHLRGMFAFCLYDIKKGKIFIYRDRMGEKPLYYYQNNESLIFASELKSILRAGIIPFELEPNSVYDYFYFQYVPEPRTPIKNINKLAAGNFIEIDLKNWNIQIKNYWKMEDSPPIDADPNSAIREELETIHKLLIRSDVPVGVALSGGLDSSTIAALATKYYPGTIQAYSVGYPGRPLNDERNDALKLAKILNLPIHEIELDTKSLVSNFEEMNFFRDDPIADISGYGYYAISKAARQNGTPVLLQGHGADELFWGYPWVVEAIKLTERYRDHGNLSNFLYHYVNMIPRGLGKRAWLKWLLSLGDVYKAFKVFQVHKSGPSNRYIFYDKTPDFQYASQNIDAYLTNEFKKNISLNSPYSIFLNHTSNNYGLSFTKMICESYLLENGITQGDRLSMASSIELRLPFVDYKLVELVIGLRKNLKTKDDYKSFPKPWLRGAMKNILPKEVLDRPKKGFAPPVDEWYRELFKVYGNQLIDGELVSHGILTKKAAKFLSTGYFPKGTISPISFKALVFENWAQQMKAQINN